MHLESMRNWQSEFCSGLPVGCSVVVAPANENAAATDAYVVRTTGDLASFGKAARTGSYYDAAINLCHGFAVGVYGVLEEEIQPKPSKIRIATS
jgi:hypothetical protein